MGGGGARWVEEEGGGGVMVVCRGERVMEVELGEWRPGYQRPGQGDGVMGFVGLVEGKM